MAQQVAVITAENAAIVLNYGTPEQAVVKGLNKLGLPVGQRSEIKLSTFGVTYATKVAGEGEMTNVTASGHMVKGDRRGQAFLKKAMHNKTKLYDETRIYLDQEADDFVTLDLITSPDGYFQVTKAGDGSATDKNAVFPFSTELIPGGQVAYFFYHYTAELAFVAGSAGVKDTITDVANGFVDAGIEAGDTLIVEGSTGNDGQYLVSAVADGTLTLATEGKLTTHAAEIVLLHAGTL